MVRESSPTLEWNYGEGSPPLQVKRTLPLLIGMSNNALNVLKQFPKMMIQYSPSLFQEEHSLTMIPLVLF